MTSTRIGSDAKTDHRDDAPTSSTPGSSRGTGGHNGRPRRETPRADRSRTGGSSTGRSGQDTTRTERSGAAAPRRQPANGSQRTRPERSGQAASRRQSADGNPRNRSARDRADSARTKRPAALAEPTGDALREDLATDDVAAPEVAVDVAPESPHPSDPVSTDAATDDEPADGKPADHEPAADGERRTPARLPRVLLTGKGLAISVLSLLLVAAVTVSILLWVKVSDVRHERDVARASNLSPTVQNQILQRASKIAVDLTTYDYRNLAAQQTTLAAESTPAFQARFAQSKDTLSTLFTSLDAVAKGTVADAAVKSTTGDTAVVLLFVNQSASSNKAKTPQSQYTRVRMTLQLVGGVWKLNQVDLV